MTKQSDSPKKIYIEVRVDGDLARLVVKEEEKSFSFERPYAKGPAAEMRQLAQELLEKNAHIPGLTIREVDLAKERELRLFSISPETAR